MSKSVTLAFKMQHNASYTASWKNRHVQITWNPNAKHWQCVITDAATHGIIASNASKDIDVLKDWAGTTVSAT